MLCRHRLPAAPQTVYTHRVIVNMAAVLRAMHLGQRPRLVHFAVPVAAAAAGAGAVGTASQAPQTHSGSVPGGYNGAA